MVARFCLYVICRNLRLFEPFIVLFFLLDLKLDYVHVGLLLAYQHGLWAVLEVPGGLLTDHWGRRRALVASFLLNGAAFVLLGSCALWSSYWLPLMLGLTLFATGESLRSGSHKAIMLHWAELTNQAERADEIIAVTRLFSKITSGAAAIAGGVVVWVSGSFGWLFASSAAVCAAGAVLVRSYPRELDGAWGNARSDERPPPWADRIRQLFAHPALIALLISSVVFESQFKTARAYLQPYLAEGFARSDIAVVGGVGGMAIGLYFLIQDVFAGLCATQGKRVKRWSQGVVPAVVRIHQLGALAIVLLAACLWFDERWLGLPGLVLIAGLQNLRRPLFVAAMDKFMDGRQRATTLSIEALARCVAYAGSVTIGGWLADRGGLRGAYVFMAVVFVAGLWPSAAVLRHWRTQAAAATAVKPETPAT